MSADTPDPVLVSAARELLILIKAQRTAGDEDLEYALARVEGMLRSQEAQDTR
jgi:hypothetical protein